MIAVMLEVTAVYRVVSLSGIFIATGLVVLLVVTLIQTMDRIRELGIGRVDILPFHQLGSGKYDAVGRSYGLGDLAALTDDQAAWIVEEASKRGLNATLHGE